jgi:tetratricopeptide (TPR) repeat protein
VKFRLCLTALIGLAAQPLVAQQIEEARTAFTAGRYDDAISQFSRLVRRQSSSADAARGLVRALVEVGRYADAVAAAERFSRDNSNSTELSNSLGETLYLIGDREGAKRAFVRASESASDSLVARYNLAVLHYESGQIEEAMQEFDRFIDVYNNSVDLTAVELTTVANAVRYLSLRDWVLAQDALRAYDEAIAADPGYLEPRVKVGYLFLERYNGTDAQPSFENVLQLNPNHPQALLGLARTMRFSSAPGATELVRQALEVNPNLVEARAYLAEIYLESEDFEHAYAEVERGLEVNPQSLEALSMLAATRFLQDDNEQFESAVRRIEALNPRYAELYNTLANVSVRTRQYAKAVEFAQRAVDLDPMSWRGFTLLGINQLRVGNMRAGRQNLQTAFEGDPHDPWTKNTLDLLDKLDQFQEMETEHFTLVMEGSELPLLSLYFGELAEEAYDSLSDKYGYRAQTPVRVEVFPDHWDFSVRTVGLTGLAALGVSFGPVIALDAPSAREVGDFNWGSTLWHELAHTFHLGMSNHRVPRWFTEGLAVYEERRARGGWGDDVTPGFLVAYKQDRLFSVSELNSGFTRPSYPEQIGYSYYQASLVFEMIERDFGFQTIVDMLGEYAAGRSTPDVVRATLAVDMDRLDEMFNKYLEQRFSVPLAALASLGSGENPHDSREDIAREADRHPDNFVAQLAMGSLLLEQGRSDDAVAYFERAKLLFPEYAGADSPYWFLAQIYLDRGESEKAAAELATLTAINERSYVARMELADVYQALGDSTSAVAPLEEALYINPMAMDLHQRLAELYAGLDRWPQAIRERKGVLATNPVDRAEAQYQLAKAYFDSGDMASARSAVLDALEDAPNFQEAQELLLAIHARRGQKDRGRS